VLVCSSVSSERRRIIGSASSVPAIIIESAKLVRRRNLPIGFPLERGRRVSECVSELRRVVRACRSSGE
jgi:hypothetical protein